MHDSSMALMKEFIKNYLKEPGMKVLDVGAQDINGCYRELFKDHEYTGMDLIAGSNVDIVGWEEVYLGDESYDVVICGQVFEHCADMMELCERMGNVLKGGGLLCIIAPTQASHHRPPDMWRFTKQGIGQLLIFSQCDVLEVKEVGRDAYGVGRRV